MFLSILGYCHIIWFGKIREQEEVFRETKVVRGMNIKKQWKTWICWAVKKRQLKGNMLTLFRYLRSVIKSSKPLLSQEVVLQEDRFQLNGNNNFVIERRLGEEKKYL